MRTSWDLRRIAAVAIGGVAGASLRLAVIEATDAGTFPWPVLAVNVVGSFVLGMVLAEEWNHPRMDLWLRDAAGIGFCGGLTTFSTFALDVAVLSRDGEYGTAAAYLLVSVAASIAAVVAGARLIGQWRAVTLPVEGEP